MSADRFEVFIPSSVRVFSKYESVMRIVSGRWCVDQRTKHVGSQWFRGTFHSRQGSIIASPFGFGSCRRECGHVLNFPVVHIPVGPDLHSTFFGPVYRSITTDLLPSRRDATSHLQRRGMVRFSRPVFALPHSRTPN